MPIIFVGVDGDICPVITCDVCGVLIDADQPGLVAWAGHTRPVFTYAHKGDCDRAAGRPHPWRPLDVFLSQLAYNHAHPIASYDRLDELDRLREGA